MQFSISRDAILPALMATAGVVDKRSTMTILGNVLMEVQGHDLILTGTDSELEVIARAQISQSQGDHAFTVPAKKLVDFCRSLSEGAEIEFSPEEGRVKVRSGKAQFSLTTLPAEDFPRIQEHQSQFEFALSAQSLKRCIDGCSFAMAQQDVRYYLNGMLMQVKGHEFRCVATDGHRLAMTKQVLDIEEDNRQLIVPRKAVLELARILNGGSDDQVQVSFNDSHIRFIFAGYSFTSKLIDGKFPDYERVIPKASTNEVIADRLALKSVLSRTSILSNEKYKGVRVSLDTNLLHVQANNPEQEEAQDELSVDYSGHAFEIGFNVSYLLDVTNAITGEQIVIRVADASSSAVIQDFDNDNATYVVMPMRL